MFTAKRTATAGELYDAFAALTRIEAERSSREKNQILIHHQENQVLKTLLYYAFNKFLQYYIKQVPSVEPAERDIEPENYAAFLSLWTRWQSAGSHRTSPGG